MALIKGKQIALNPDGIATGNLNDNAVTTVKVANGAVTTEKIGINADLPMATFKITGLGSPIAGTDAANKAYVDSVAEGLDVKASCAAATAAALDANTATPLTLTADANGQLAVDSMLPANGARILVKNEALSENNGIYVVTDQGSVGTGWVLTRSSDADTSAEVTSGMFTFIEDGNTNADTGWVLTTDTSPIVIGTTPLTFTQFSGAGSYTAGQGIRRTGTEFSLTSADAGLVFAGATESTHTVSINWGLVTSITTDDANALKAAGTAESAARADHQHDLTTAVPSVTIKSEATAASVGVAASVLRTDAQIQAATAVPAGDSTPGYSIISDNGSALQGSASTLMRSDAVLTASTATAVSVAAANAQGASEALSRADHAHATPIDDGAGQGQSPSPTAGENQPTGILAGVDNALGMVPSVFVNGMRYPVTDAGTGGVCYFGAAGVAYSAIASTDELYWNGVTAGFDLAASDVVDVLINALA